MGLVVDFQRGFEDFKDAAGGGEGSGEAVGNAGDGIDLGGEEANDGDELNQVAGGEGEGGVVAVGDDHGAADEEDDGEVELA